MALIIAGGFIVGLLIEEAAATRPGRDGNPRREEHEKIRI
jgi:hypothetical protein